MNTCPTEPRLTACLLGDLPKAEADAVRAHIETCPACRAAAAELAPMLDTLRAALEKLMDDQKLDGLVYLHNLYPAQYINEPQVYTKVKLSSVSGLPAICVPAGFTQDNQPVGVEFLARAFAERDLLALAHGYESATRHRILPATTPPLPGERFSY